MSTLHTFRLLITIPEELGDSFGRWYSENIDPNDNTSTWPRRNRQGKARQIITHRISDGAYTDAQAQLLANKLAEMSHQPVPDWSSMSFDQRVAWFNNLRPDTYRATGVYPVSAVNTSDIWPDAVASDAAVKVQPINDVGEVGSTIFAVQIWPERLLSSDWLTTDSRVTKDFFVSDVIAELTLQGNGGIVLRQAQENSCWVVSLQVGPPTKVLLWKLTPPLGFNIAAERTFPTSAKSVVTAKTAGNSITVSLNNVPIIQHVDAYNNTKTRHGFMSNSAWTSFSVRQ